MRKINKIIVHCTATPEGRDVSVADLRRWHVRDNGWKDIGYHFFIDIAGNVHRCRPVEQTGAHVAGHNVGSIGVCYAGGVDKNLKPKDTRNTAQRLTLANHITTLRHIYPNATVHGHNEFSNKACPSFDVKKESWAK